MTTAEYTEREEAAFFAEIENTRCRWSQNTREKRGCKLLPEPGSLCVPNLGMDGRGPCGGGLTHFLRIFICPHGLQDRLWGINCVFNGLRREIIAGGAHFT